MDLGATLSKVYDLNLMANICMIRRANVGDTQQHYLFSTASFPTASRANSVSCEAEYSYQSWIASISRTNENSKGIL